MKRAGGATLLLLALWLLALAHAGEPGALLAFAPLLVLVLTLAAGRTPGERSLHRLRVGLLRVPASRRPSPSPAMSAPPRIRRGGLFVALSIAGRGPPDRVQHQAI
jgi:hypothetical protein